MVTGNQEERKEAERIDEKQVNRCGMEGYGGPVGKIAQNDDGNHQSVKIRNRLDQIYGNVFFKADGRKGSRTL